MMKKIIIALTPLVNVIRHFGLWTTKLDFSPDQLLQPSLIFEFNAWNN
jgi:hypothetical protein